MSSVCVRSKVEVFFPVGNSETDGEKLREQANMDNITRITSGSVKKKVIEKSILRRIG